MKISNSALYQRVLERTQQQQQKALQQLASGQRLQQAADDAAGLGISTRLNSQSRGLAMAIRNGGDGLSRIQVEDGALSSVQADLEAVRALKVQSGNGILNDGDRQAIDAEIQQRQANIQQTLSQGQFNGRALFGDEPLSFQLGTEAGDSVTLSAFNVADQFSQLGVDIEDPQALASDDTSLTTLDKAMASITSRQTELGAVANTLTSRMDRLAQSDIEVQAANSRITDADFAKAAAEKTKQQILGQAAIGAAAQANEQSSSVLRLLLPVSA